MTYKPKKDGELNAFVNKVQSNMKNSERKTPKRVELESAFKPLSK